MRRGVSKQIEVSEFYLGKEIVDLVLDRLRKLADNCTGLQGTCNCACSVFSVAMIS